MRIKERGGKQTDIHTTINRPTLVCQTSEKRVKPPLHHSDAMLIVYLGFIGVHWVVTVISYRFTLSEI